MKATATARKILEDIEIRRELVRGMRPLQTGEGRIDRENGVIRGVKVLGLVSDNGRRYLAEAARAAIALYEGISVRCNHPLRGDKNDRPVEDVFGWLRDVRADDAGELWADLHYLKAHPMAERVCEAAERNPTLFGLSHNADGQGEKLSDGTFVVSEITEVRSVDLVADPATVEGLFESRRKAVKKTKLRAFLEGIEKRFDAGKRKRVRGVLKVFEAMGDEVADHEIEADEPEKMKPEDHLWHGVKEACKATIEADDMDAAEKGKKVSDMLKAHEKMTANTDEADDDDDDEPKEKPSEGAEESRKTAARLAFLESERDCLKLCRAEGFTPSDTLLEALCALPSESKRKALIKESKGRKGVVTQGGSHRIPEGQGYGNPGDNAGAIDTSQIKDGKTFAEACRAGRFSGRED